MICPCLVILGSKWMKSALTYSYTNPTKPSEDLSAAETKREIARAFKVYNVVYLIYLYICSLLHYFEVVKKANVMKRVP